MVQAMVYGKASSRRRQPKPETKQCLFCNTSFHRSKQSRYCSDYCVQKASRRRREALVEALAALMVDTSCEVTAILYGVAFQIPYDLAYTKAEDCIRHRRKPAELKLKQLGFVYNESSKEWTRHSRLPAPLG